eukprot:TRINITY_DN743_c1_g1_i1.p1 TRINITY_DN743_c1_g1~~TRINITY_DN743_c1_g1_i1.p1  ORF type:complete len:542 (+),score=81.02 TRINITY_DN743_c1_g1_i1:34-1659(+)
MNMNPLRYLFLVMIAGYALCDECKDGETKQMDCNTCLCRNGVFVCTEVDCPLPPVPRPTCQTLRCEVDFVCVDSTNDAATCVRVDRPTLPPTPAPGLTCGGLAAAQCPAGYDCVLNCPAGTLHCEGTCVKSGSTCTDGETKKVDCNSCTCISGVFVCTDADCPIPPVPKPTCQTLRCEVGFVCVDSTNDAATCVPDSPPTPPPTPAPGLTCGGLAAVQCPTGYTCFYTCPDCIGTCKISPSGCESLQCPPGSVCVPGANGGGSCTAFKTCASITCSFDSTCKLHPTKGPVCVPTNPPTCATIECESGAVCREDNTFGAECTYDCQSIHWTESKSNWCCLNQHIGCPTQAPDSRKFCKLDSDCNFDQFCRSIDSPSGCTSMKECVRRSGEGEQCGGTASSECNLGICLESLHCAYPTGATDSPGKCVQLSVVDLCNSCPAGTMCSNIAGSWKCVSMCTSSSCNPSERCDIIEGVVTCTSVVAGSDDDGLQNTILIAASVIVSMMLIATIIGFIYMRSRSTPTTAPGIDGFDTMNKMVPITHH